MNSSDSYSPADDSGHLLSGVEVMVGFIFIITIMTIISYFITLCRADRVPGLLPYHRDRTGNLSPGTTVGPGLDEATIKAFPKLLFSKANIISTYKLDSTNNVGKINSVNYSNFLSCSICLADYDESDVIRVLPDCGHVFHLECVDSWLRLHPTCPLCRKLPTPPTSPESFKVSVHV